MDILDEMLRLALEKYHEEFGEDAKMEDEEEFVAVFNDAVMILSLEDGNMRVKVIAGEPCYIDFDANLVEENADEYDEFDEDDFDEEE